MDFFEPYKKISRGITYIEPKFKICKSKDLMIRGRDFYAVWDEESGRWCRDQDDAIRIVDDIIKAEVMKHKNKEEPYIGKYMWDSDSGMIDKWNKYTQKQMRDNYHPLDNKIIFSNSVVKREDYSTHRLDYPLKEGSIDAYEELMSTLYDPDERKKLEWAIGAIVSGDSVWIQKFIVIVGDPGTGKSTFFKILRMLFPGYLATINAKALGDGHSAFALEPLKNDPLVAIEDDADLSRITDNTRLNSLVSHEPMTVNEKFKAQYENVFHAFIFLGSNKDVKITDSSSGLTRRLIDVVPSGRRLDFDRYNEVMKKLPFELGAIAYHCLQVYYHNKKKYNDYLPVRMLRATNLIYSFLEEYYKDLLGDNDGCRFHDLWNAYTKYCELSKVEHPHTRQEFRNELRPYFKEYLSSYEYAPGQTCAGYFKGFKYEKLGIINKAEETIPTTNSIPDWLIMDKVTSKLDEFLKDYPAQLTKSNGSPKQYWENVKTTLKDILTSELHYVKVPEYLICIDFDIPDSEGNKDKEANLRAASMFPKTYAEWSKSGSGIHLHYIYKGDVKKLSRVFDDHIEVKVFTGDASLRRKLIGCNDVPIAELSSGLPLKGEDKKMLDSQSLANEKALRTCIIRCFNKEHHGYTTPELQLIKKVTDDAYNNPDVTYDISDLESAVLDFALSSSHQSDYCNKLVDQIHFKSKNFENDISNQQTPEVKNSEELPQIVYDVEVFQNLFLVCWKYRGAPDDTVVKMFNPSAKDIELLYLNYRLSGFNNRGYDAHIMRGSMYGYTPLQLFNLSQTIVNSDGNEGKFSEAYRQDYCDVYDYATIKQSLKKWEIDLDIFHVENSHPWDEPLPEEYWEEVGNYCANDVNAADKVMDACEADFKARCLLSDLSGLPIIDTNRQHITKIIFNGDKNPNLVYTDLSTGKQTFMDGTEYKGDFLNKFEGYEFNEFGIDSERYLKGPDGKPKFVNGKSIYMTEDPSEGGYVFEREGMWYNVWCFDISGLHPASLIAMNKFGEYTKIYKEIRDARLYIKHNDYESASKLLDGKLAKYLNNPKDAKNLSKALKLILNSTYGFCSAKFANPFKDPRDKDNIVAKRGALFMISLKNKVIEMGYTVIHCKTDSIKVVNPDERVINFINDFGHKYGYEFEVEHKFEKICLVNRSTYIGKYSEPELDKNGNEIWWDAKAAEFAHPYIYKTCFTKEPIEFKDYCEFKKVNGAMYLDFNENLPDVTFWEELKKARLYFETGRTLTKKAMNLLDEYKEYTDKMIDEEIAKGHNYIFIGRVGLFVPVEEGAGGGVLLVKRGDTMSAVTGTKGYRWMESETVKNLHKENYICKDYYRKLVDEAILTIEQYGDYDKFVDSDEDASYPF